MDARLNLLGDSDAAKSQRYIVSAGKVVSGSTQPAGDYQPGQSDDGMTT